MILLPYIVVLYIPSKAMSSWENPLRGDQCTTTGMGEPSTIIWVRLLNKRHLPWPLSSFSFLPTNNSLVEKLDFWYTTTWNWVRVNDKDKIMVSNYYPVWSKCCSYRAEKITKFVKKLCRFPYSWHWYNFDKWKLQRPLCCLNCLPALAVDDGLTGLLVGLMVAGFCVGLRGDMVTDPGLVLSAMQHLSLLVAQPLHRYS